MHIYRIRLVPDSSPNATGRWTEVGKYRLLPPGSGHRWSDVETFFQSDIPKGEHIILYEHVYSNG